MSYIDDFIKGGYWPLQHFERDYDLDLRYVRYACRVETRDEEGFYTVQDQTAGDVLGAVLWPAADGTSQLAPVQASSTKTARFAGRSSSPASFSPNTSRLNTATAKFGKQLGAAAADPSASKPTATARDFPGWAFGWPATVSLTASELLGATVTKAGVKAAEQAETRPYWVNPIGDAQGEAADGFSPLEVNVPREASIYPPDWTGIVHAAADPHEQVHTWHADFLGLVTSPLTPESRDAMDFNELFSTRVYGASAATPVQIGGGISYKDAAAAPLHSLLRTMRLSTNEGFDVDSALVLYSPLVAFNENGAVQVAALNSVITAGAGAEDFHHSYDSIDGVPVNEAHVKTDAPFFHSREFDGPLDFEAREMDAPNEGTIRFKTRLHWNSGKWQWSTGLPLFQQAEQEDGPGGGPPPPGGGGPGGPGGPGPGGPGDDDDDLHEPTLQPGSPFPQGEPYPNPPGFFGTFDESVGQIPYAPGNIGGVGFDPAPNRQHKHHQHATVGSPHEWHVPGVAFRPTPVAGGDRHALDTRYNYNLTPGQVREFTERPVTARLEAFGHEDGTGRYSETCNNYALARYQDAESVSGGIVLTPPEIGIEHVAGVLDDAGLWKSHTYFVALAGDSATDTDVWFATGTPDVLTGGVNTGFRWGGYSDGVLAFESLSATGTGSELLRMSATTITMATGKIFDGSTARVQISQGADTGRSETPMAGELYASNDKNLLRLTTET